MRGRSGVNLGWLAPAGAVGVAAGAALPWAHSGRRGVSGYDLAGVARTFGLTEGGVARAATAAWLCLPLAATGAVALAALGRQRTAVAVSVIVALAGLLVGSWVVKVARGSSGIGAPVTIGSALLTLVGAIAGVARTPRRT